jgi:hypothetical protein
VRFLFSFVSCITAFFKINRERIGGSKILLLYIYVVKRIFAGFVKPFKLI